MKIVNNRKMLISLMTIFGFSVFVESNCCMAAGKFRAKMNEDIQRVQAERAQQTEQARAQQAEQAQRTQINQNTRDINDIGARLQIVENNLQDQINPNINAVRNDLQELREQIVRQNHRINIIYGAGSLLGGAVAICFFYCLKRTK